MLNGLLNLLFGWRRYSVRIEYSVRGQTVFSVEIAVGVITAMNITNRREIAKGALRAYPELMTKLQSVVRNPLSRDGLFAVKPVCYLGRWK